MTLLTIGLIGFGVLFVLVLIGSIVGGAIHQGEVGYQQAMRDEESR